MNSYTVHLRSGSPPILVREGWSAAASTFGPFFFTAHRAWLPALAHGALLALIVTLAPPWLRGILLTALAVLAGLMARDVLRWSLDRKHYVMAHVVAARDEDAALGRLLDARPDLVPLLAKQEL